MQPEKLNDKQISQLTKLASLLPILNKALQSSNVSTEQKEKYRAELDRVQQQIDAIKANNKIKDDNS